MSPREPTVLTIVLNYRTASLSARAAEAAVVAMKGIKGGIIIVDNCSDDGSFETLSSVAHRKGWLRDDRVRVLQSGHNGGFGAGNNFGMRAGLPDGQAPDYVFLLNSDAFADPDAISHLVAELEATPRAGIAGSHICATDRRGHQTAFRFPTFLSEFEGAARTGPISRLLKKYIVPLPVPSRSEPIDWTVGAAMMMRQSMLDEIGLFDEKYFLYFEETDLCLRAARAGWSTQYVRTSEVIHLAGKSTGSEEWARIPGYWLDSRLYYFTKNHGVAYAALATAAHILGGLIWRFRQLLSRKKNADPPRFLVDLTVHALRAFWRGAFQGKRYQTQIPHQINKTIARKQA